MNIFHLDYDPKKSAQYHCDKHVVKMIVEYAQIMSTAHHILDGSKDERLYKSTHANHPANVWVRTCWANYRYLYDLWVHLCEEYTHRYGKEHATYTKLRDVLRNVPKEIKECEEVLSVLPQCMPDYCKVEGNPVEAYRNYYRNEKASFATWKKREVPEWWNKT